jgi:cysteine desulfurase
MKRVYLDHAASTPILPTAKKAMMEAMEIFGNPSSIHHDGRVAKNIIENARTEVAKLINASPDEIIFTSGGTESNNIVLHTFRGKRVAVSAIEHPSVIAIAAKQSSIAIATSLPDLIGQSSLPGSSEQVRR